MQNTQVERLALDGAWAVYLHTQPARPSVRVR